VAPGGGAEKQASNEATRVRSQRRADAVKALLALPGVAPAQVEAFGAVSDKAQVLIVVASGEIVVPVDEAPVIEIEP